MTAFDDLLLANGRLQRSTSVAPATKDLGASLAKWATDIELRLAPPTPPYWLADFSKPWDTNLWVPETSGGTAIVAIESDPLDGSRKSLRLGTTTATGGPNVSSAAAALYINQPHAYAREGEDVWYAVDQVVAAEARFVRGVWDWNHEWHIPGTVPQNPGGVSNSFGVACDFTDPPSNPRFTMRISGGDYHAPTQAWSTEVPVVRGRVYRWLHHFHWSQKPTGLYELWLDGSKVWSYTGPNLFLDTSGNPAECGFGLYNYHAKPANPPQDYALNRWYRRAACGPTRESVA